MVNKDYNFIAVSSNVTEERLVGAGATSKPQLGYAFTWLGHDSNNSGQSSTGDTKSEKQSD